MKKHDFLATLTFLFLSFSLQLFSQTTHNISVTDFSFTPSNLNIAVGDIVKWTNNQGTHNVDGSKTKYPANPESFGNDGGAGSWTYSFTFSIAGTYDYQCSFHGASMAGKINVGTSTRLENVLVHKPLIKIFPNPCDGILHLDLANLIHKKNDELIFKIYDTKGSLVKMLTVLYIEKYPMDLSALKPGAYNYILSNSLEVYNTGMFIKK